MTTMTEPALSPADVTVLRENAKSNDYNERLHLSVRAEHEANEDGYDDLKGTITVSREFKMPGCDPEYVTRRYPIPAKVRIDRFDRDYTSDHGGASFYAGASHYHSSDRSALRTLANMVKAGDQVVIHFLIGNNTESLTKVGMTHDECYLAVYRPVGAKLRLIGDVYIDDIIAPVGSSARMVYYR